MDRNLIQGTGVALITPFDTLGEVDYQALKDLVNYVIYKGVDFVVAMGTTSETATLNANEKAKILETIISEVEERVPVVLGMGGNNTKDLIENIKSTSFDKVDAILSVAPYYNKPNQDGMFAHFSAVAEVSPVPIILYNVPGRTSSNLLPQTVIKLAQKYDNIIAIKEASSNFDQVMELIQHKAEDFKVFSGDDALTLPLMSLGMEGVISVVANVLPEEMSNMLKAINVGDYDEAKEIHYSMLDLINALFEEGNPAGIKSALLQAEIIPSDNLRLPLVPVSQPLKEKIKSLL